MRWSSSLIFPLLGLLVLGGSGCPNGTRTTRDAGDGPRSTTDARLTGADGLQGQDLRGVAAEVAGDAVTADTSGDGAVDSGPGMGTDAAVDSPPATAIDTAVETAPDAAAADTAPVLAPAMLALAPPLATFAPVILGGMVQQTLTLTNQGGETTGVPSLSFDGAAKAAFTVASTTCSAALAPTTGCSITVAFRPTVAGTATASLVATAVPGGTTSAALAGTGLGPALLTISPAPFDFGRVGSARLSEAKLFVVKNIGGEPSGALTVSLDNPSGAFAFDGAAPGTCADPAVQAKGLAPQETCTANLFFAPGPRGLYTATMTIGATPGGNATAMLSGTAISPVITIAPTFQEFGTVGRTRTSVRVDFAVGNEGDVPTEMLRVAPLMGPDAARFPSVTQCPAVLAVGARCITSVRFSPADVGVQTAIMYMVHAQGTSPAVNLRGTGGADPGFLILEPVESTLAENPVGTASLHTLGIRNASSTPSGVPMLTITGPHAADFRIASTTCLGPIPPMATPPAMPCGVTVEFKPSATGLRTAYLRAEALPGGATWATMDGRGL